MDDAVQSSVPPGGRVDHPADLVLVGDVGGLVSHRTGAIACLRRDLVLRGGEATGVAADEHHVATRGDDCRGDTLADATATAGDDEGPIRQRKLHHCP